jgi:hypothetical protein
MWHPDRFVDGTTREREDAAAEFVRISNAYEVLLAAPTSIRATHPPRETPAADTVPAERGVRAYFGLGAPAERSVARRVSDYLGFGGNRAEGEDG